MIRSIKSRSIGILFAAAVFCGNAAILIPALPAAAAETALPDAEELSRSEELPVIVTLDGSTALDIAGNPEELDSAGALSASGRARRQQNAVIGKLRKWYPELEPDYQYTTLLNAFACTMPQALIPYAEQLDGVKSVSVAQTVTAAPKMAAAAALGSIPAYYDETGCRGEGQVIAIIDTELDLDHPMFAPLPDDVDIKLKKEDVEAIADGIGLNVDPGWYKGWRSTKIPYAINYSNINPSAVRNESDYWYHGTHVAGIAAGNPYETEEGKLISGVAPNAQLLFMSLDSFGFIETNFIAALEDAVKLKADVVNYSIGSEDEILGKDHPLADAINAAEEAGVTVCIAAGNSDNGSQAYGETHTADNPDVSYMNSFLIEGEKSLAVASADNAVTMQLHSLIHDGITIPYTGCMQSESGDVLYLGDQLGETEYAYEYCGLGKPSDFADKDLTGKLALVDRGEIYFEEKANNAKKAGAVGVIVIQNAAFTNMAIMSGSDLLLAMVSIENGKILKNAENKTLRFSADVTDYTFPTAVSDYTSWGVHNTLELRPDIMGVGAMVESAAYHGKTSVMSGTSMASPYVAGCAAILNEYLEKNGCTLTGSERQRYIRNLLMTGAVPYRENGLPVTPRRQGAGLVSVDQVVHEKVLLTGAEGESKLSLRDGLGTSFSFPVTMTNISGEDVSFPTVRLELTTDDAAYDEKLKDWVIGGQQALSFEAELDGLSEIAAGESRTETVTVTLDAAQAAAIHEIFVNGYFIEGYLFLEDAENCSDISVPLLGFSDCFADMPLFGKYCASIVNTTGALLAGTTSYFEQMQKVERKEWPEYPDLEGLTDDEVSQALSDFYLAVGKTEEDLKAISDTVYISPNHDFLADYPGFLVDVDHNCLANGVELLDEKGNLAAKGFEEIPLAQEIRSDYCTAIFPNEATYDLPEGTYTMRLTAGMTEEALQNHPQKLETKVVVDKTAPELKSELTEKDGRKILRLTAKDEYLDSLIVFGKGSGTLLNGDAYARIQGKGLEAEQMYALKGSYGAGWILDCFYDMKTGDETDVPRSIRDDEYTAMKKKNSNYAQMFGVKDLSLIEWETQFDYSECIKAEPDKDGVFTVEYDVTDFEMYHFVVFDRAFNSAFTEDLNLLKTIPAGIYKGLHGLYEFTEDTLRFIPFGYGIKPCSYSYEITADWENTTLILTPDQEDSLNENPSSYWVNQLSATRYNLFATSDGSGFQRTFGFLNTCDEIIELTDLTDADAYLAVSAYEAENNYVIPLMEQHTGRTQIDILDYAFEPDAVVTYSCFCSTPGKNNLIKEKVTVDLKTGIAVLPDGTEINLLEDVPYLRGDTDCSGEVDVADAVLLSRMLTEDREAVVTAQGKRNADCNQNGRTEIEDVAMILQAIAKLIQL